MPSWPLSMFHADDQRSCLKRSYFIFRIFKVVCFNINEAGSRSSSLLEHVGYCCQAWWVLEGAKALCRGVIFPTPPPPPQHFVTPCPPFPFCPPPLLLPVSPSPLIPVHFASSERTDRSAAGRWATHVAHELRSRILNLHAQ
jgi:hypothetical protein